jgi:hypothetical protein
VQRPELVRLPPFTRAFGKYLDAVKAICRKTHPQLWKIARTNQAKWAVVLR